MLMSAADYRESLRRLHPVVYVDGRRIESVADEPLLAPGINAIGVSYDFALRESTQALMRTEGPDFDGPINRMLAIPRNERRPAQQARGGAPRLPGDRLRAALSRRRCACRDLPRHRAHRRRGGHRLSPAPARLRPARLRERSDARHRDDRRQGRPLAAPGAAAKSRHVRPHRRAPRRRHRHLRHQGDRDRGALRARAAGHARPQHDARRTGSSPCAAPCPVDAEGLDDRRPAGGAPGRGRQRSFPASTASRPACACSIACSCPGSGCSAPASGGTPARSSTTTRRSTGTRASRRARASATC